MKRHILGSLLALALGGCALSQSTDKIVLDYNRDFAKARNEVLLLNVLRAAAREPLQFSTMGSVNGQIGNSTGLSIPFTNLIAGGPNVISPSLSFSDAINPTVAINPLASKEFAAGILRPMGTDTIQLFLHNGWDPEFLLPLIVGGVVCPDRRLLQNSGEYLEYGDGGWRPTATHLAFKNFFYESAPNFTVGSATAGDTALSYELGDKDAVDVLRNGVGASHSIVAVEEGAAGKKKLVIQKGDSPAILGFNIAKLCASVPVRAAGEPIPLSAEVIASLPGAHGTGDQGKIIFRSVGSIIHYLGESHRMRFRQGVNEPRGLTYLNRTRSDQILFRIGWGLDRGPRAVDTRFQDTVFFIPRMDLRHGEDDDRTLKTLSFLDQLIALQTSESSIRGAQPVVTVN